MPPTTTNASVARAPKPHQLRTRNSPQLWLLVLSVYLAAAGPSLSKSQEPAEATPVPDSQKNFDSENSLGATKIRMDPYLERLFASPNDFQLVDKLFVRIEQNCDPSSWWSVRFLRKEHKVVLDVWGAGGMIGNGGFQFLFESDIADFAGIAKSYDAIGAHDAAQAVRDALKLFPNSKPHRDVDKRLEYLEQLGPTAKEKLEEYSKVIWDSNREIQRKVAAYVRAHRWAFARTKPSQWEDLKELQQQDLEPPASNARDEEIAKWLESIDARYERRDDISEHESRYVTLPAAGNPIVSITLSDDRNSTDIELDQLTKYEALRELRILELDETLVTQNGLTHLQRFPNLQLVRLNKTDTEGTWLDCLIPLKGLKELELADTPIADNDMRSLAKIPSLQRLSLRATAVSDAGLKPLAALKNLKSLDAGHTRITSIDSLHGLPIEELSLMRSQIQDDGLRSLGSFVHLKVVDLSHTSVSDVALRHLSACQHLEDLFLSSTRITDAGLENLQTLVQLRSLYAENTRINGGGFARLAQLKKLENLQLYGTDINDEGLGHIGNISSLQELSLSETAVTDAGLVHVVRLTNLRSLSLSGTRVSGGAALRDLASLKSLEFLALPPSLKETPSVLYLQEQLPDTDLSFF